MAYNDYKYMYIIIVMLFITYYFIVYSRLSSTKSEMWARLFSWCSEHNSSDCINISIQLDLSLLYKGQITN